MSHLSSRESFEKLGWFRLGFYFVAATVLLVLGTGSFGEGEAPFAKAAGLWHFFFVGIIAATVANSTGAGGGIVFLPVFTLLGLSVGESLATSFAIQCFGMTAGALTWLRHLARDAIRDLQSESFRLVFLVGASGSLAGLKLAQEFLPNPSLPIEWFFSSFSLVVGVIILVRTVVGDQVNGRREKAMGLAGFCGLGAVALVGGAITAWLSVGVGEMLAIYLIALGFRINLAVAVAVCVTSITVITAVPFYFASSLVMTEVLVFAAPGALIGGTLAKQVAVLLGARRLKLGMASWIIITAIVYVIF